MTLAEYVTYDNTGIDGLVWVIGMSLIAAVCLKVAAHINRPAEEPPAEPLSHVKRVPSELEDRLHLSIFDAHRANLDHNQRTLKVGVDVHRKACGAGDKLECVCWKGTA